MGKLDFPSLFAFSGTAGGKAMKDLLTLSEEPEEC